MMLPVHQLTRYEMDCPLEEDLCILKQTMNVLEARLDINFEEQSWPDSIEPVGLSHFRRLYVSKPGALKYFKAPALEELVPRDNGADLLPLIHVPSTGPHVPSGGSASGTLQRI
jgi:hypothetical protein